jgi:riboflavin biosynthesis pyrimidine reductase
VNDAQPRPDIAHIAPAGAPLELLFEHGKLAHFALPPALVESYGGELGLPKSCVYANFVASLEGIVALPGATESGQIISGRNAADRFVMGLLRACAGAVLLGAGTFRKSGGHLWHPDRIYPPGAAAFAQARQQLGLEPRPRFALLSASGNVDVTQPALEHAFLFTTAQGEATLRGKLPSSTRLIVQDGARLDLAQVLSLLRAEGHLRVLTEGGPALFSELVQGRLVDELFLTSSPALFGRFENDHRKALTDGLDLQGASLDLRSVRRHGSHLFLRYALKP